MIVKNTYVFTKPIIYDGDFAANAILIDRAKHFGLLIGNYSRVRFNHPGPALLYVQAWSEVLLHDVTRLVPEPYNSHQFAIMALNALLLGAVASIIHQHCHSVASAFGFVAIGVLFAGSLAATLVQPWMPFVYICPFFLFLVASASVLAGRSGSLPLLVVGGGLLIHGHVSFVPIVGGISLLVLGAVLVRHRSNLAGYLRSNLRLLAGAGAVLAIFVLPILLNLFLHWPGEFGKYIDYAQRNQANHHGIVASARFVAGYWPASGVVSALIAALMVGLAVATTLLCPLDDCRHFCWSVLAVAGVATLLFLQYALAGVDDFSFRYVGDFYLVVPAVVLGTSLIAMLSSLRLTASRVVRVGAVVGIFVITISSLCAPGFHSRYRGDGRIPSMLEALATDPRRHGRVVALDFPITEWPTAVAVMEYGAHHGLRSCTTDETLAFLVTSRFVCPAAGPAGYWHLIMQRASGGTGPDPVFVDPVDVIAPDSGP
jgi:hypothetical protein